LNPLKTNDTVPQAFLFGAFSRKQACSQSL
jgi:hypothetical protein